MLEPLVQKIANEFVSEAAASEVASAGLNAIREICVRQPLAMSNTLLQDLVMYRKSKDKGVMMAAKGLLSLYREVGAELLKKKDRGKAATMGLKSGERRERRFGEEEIGGIEGIELLEEWKKEEERRKRVERGEISGEDNDQVEDDERNWAAWNVEEEEDSDDSGGWINVDDDQDIEISDSDEDVKPPSKKPKTQTDHDELDPTFQDGHHVHPTPKETNTSKLATTKASLSSSTPLRHQSPLTPPPVFSNADPNTSGSSQTTRTPDAASDRQTAPPESIEDAKEPVIPSPQRFHV